MSFIPSCASKRVRLLLQAVLEVVLWLHEEEAVDAPYIQAVLAEFEAACETCNVAVPPKLRVLSLDVALQQGNTHQVQCTREHFLVSFQP